MMRGADWSRAGLLNSVHLIIGAIGKFQSLDVAGKSFVSVSLMFMVNLHRRSGAKPLEQFVRVARRLKLLARSSRSTDSGVLMSQRSPLVTQADVTRVLRAAKNAGAAEVRLDSQTTIVVRFTASSEIPDEPREKIIL